MFKLGNAFDVKKDEVIFNESMTPSLILCNPKYAHNLSNYVFL